ncbi:hypothetical protein ABT095_28900 [Kitasatospora sp. NPDC002227]|uniref:hypothetical protein n=1 Tax=Kitasatospora sp. NPDC002227 TaxID=3154773 RepID=UPI0033286FA1
MALGDLIGHEEGQIVVQRVLPGDHGLPPTVESSFKATGTLLGVAINDIGTYVGRMRADGTLDGDGQGILMSPTGDSVTWQGRGVGSFGPDGSIRWVGSLTYVSASPAFAGLRGIVGLFEWTTTQDGGASGDIRAWQ